MAVMGPAGESQLSTHRRTMSLESAERKVSIEKPHMDISKASNDRVHDDEALLESQPAVIESTATPLEYSVPLGKKLSYLALYFLLNLSLTLSNKAILQQVCKSGDSINRSV